MVNFKSLSVKSFSPFAIILLFLAFTLIIQNSYLKNACENKGDFELHSLNVEAAASFKSLTGSYSRFEFRHPGPVIAYLHAGTAPLFFWIASPFGKIQAAQAAINSFWLILAILLLRRAGSRIGSQNLFASLAVLFFNAADPHWITNPWNPIFCVAPFLVLMLAVNRAQIRSASLLPLVLVTGSILVQAHLGLLIPVGILCGFALIDFFRNGVRASDVVLAAVAVGGVWIAPLYEALSRPGFGNFGEIYEFILQSGAHPPISNSLAFLGRYTAEPIKRIQLVLPFVSSLRFSNESPLLLLLGLNLLLFRRMQPFQRSSSILCWLMLAVGFFSYLLIKGHPFSHLLQYQNAVSFLLLWTTIETAIEWKKIRTGNLPEMILSVLAILAASIPLTTPRNPKCVRAARLESFLDKLEEKLGAMKNRPIMLIAKNARAIHFLDGLTLSMVRRGYSVCTEERLWFLVDWPFVCSTSRSVSGSNKADLIRIGLWADDPEKLPTPKPGVEFHVDGSYAAYWNVEGY